jgi:hypothetical protein
MSVNLGRMVIREERVLPHRTSAFSTISYPREAMPGGPLQPAHIGLFSPGETTVSGAHWNM